jgi:putative spermidine/putrescine transport system substrate-binding protein/spermidine/putrescine transport system substrate-binding protein
LNKSILIFTTILYLYFSAVNAEEINIYTWEGYFSEKVIKSFYQQTGHSVKLFYYDNEGFRDELLLNNKANKFDLIIVDNLSLELYNKSNIFYNFSNISIHNKKHINQKWLNACGNKAIPYAKGTIGIAYRTTVSEQPVTSWQQLLSPPEEHTARTSMLKDDVDTAAIALLANGLPPFSEKEDELKTAYESLKQQQSHLLTYQYGTAYALKHKEKSTLSLTMAYAGDVATLIKHTKQKDWVYVVPDEGTVFWIDCLTAPKNKMLSPATVMFLEFINEPINAINNAQDAWFSTTNDGALLLGDENYLNNPDLFTSEEIQTRSHFYQTISPEYIKLRQRMNAALKLKNKNKK